MNRVLSIILLMVPLLLSAQDNRQSLIESVYNSSLMYDGDDSSLFRIFQVINKNLNAKDYPIKILNGNLYYALGNTPHGLSKDETANTLAGVLQTTPKDLKEMCLWVVQDYTAENGIIGKKEGVNYNEIVKEFFDNPDKNIENILTSLGLTEFNLYLPENCEWVLYAIDRAISEKNRIQRKSLPLEVYRDSIVTLSVALFEKLEKFQKEYSKSKIKTMVENTIEDLENTTAFYLEAPSKINMDWDSGERPFKRTDKSRNDYSNYESKSYVAMLNEDNEIIYWPSNSWNHQDNYNSCGQVTFYDPSGREITVLASLPSIGQWEIFMKNTSKEVGYQEVGRRVANFTDLNTGNITPSLIKSNVPICWRADSKMTQNSVILPFGKLRSSTTSTVIHGYDISCRDIESLSIHIEKTNIQPDEKAKSIGIIATNYNELLEWYKKSLQRLEQRLMSRIEAYKINETRKATEQQQRLDSLNSTIEAARKSALPQFLKTAAERIRNEKRMFDYVLGYVNYRPCVQILTNSNSLKLYNDFWKILESEAVENGNLILRPSYYQQEGQSWKMESDGTELEYNYPLEDIDYLLELFKDIQKALRDNLSNFLVATTELAGSINAIESPAGGRLNQIRFSIKTMNKEPWTEVPILISSFQPKKGDPICLGSIDRQIIVLQDYNKKGYNLKLAE